MILQPTGRRTDWGRNTMPGGRSVGCRVGKSTDASVAVHHREAQRVRTPQGDVPAEATQDRTTPGVCFRKRSQRELQPEGVMESAFTGGSGHSARSISQAARGLLRQRRGLDRGRPIDQR
jgi:hypothetical protein